VTPAVARFFNRFVGGDTTIPVTLGLRNIYILPTGHGLIFILVLGAMFIGSINYNNNLGFLLTFLLGSLGLTAMMHTYGMLYGLRLQSARALPVFAGDSVEVTITLAGVERPRTGLRWYFGATDHVRTDLNSAETTQVVVRAITDRRGRFDPGWLRIACEYPLGLFRAWARINTDLNCLVYPRPIPAPRPDERPQSLRGAGDIARTVGVDDFQGLSAYQPGDPPGRIHWQAYSRGRGLHTKSFAGRAGTGIILDFMDIKADDTEGKLAILCFHVLQAHRQQCGFGMKLAGTIIPVGSGRGHRDRCLRSLALFGKR
jgi:uncharacterized protein (DUF58 family)